MTGAAKLIAEYNGVDKIPHVRKKLAWMAYVTETVQMLSKQACLEPISEFGMDVMMPSRMAINASKFTYASNFHTICQHMHDIGGGLTTTVPAYRDWSKLEAAVRRAAHMDGWQSDSTDGRLPLIKDCVKMPGLDESYEGFAPTLKMER
ncbi:MAG: hypothetical protein A2277_06685 [Desulfobacterales bacterium RIFOXYA12_FULL_46_15]|nr:MAG: hypothetical protein A2277_06685 [Desulfobacterales bacterium RIFOXYA12_FULL_46_15]